MADSSARIFTVLFKAPVYHVSSTQIAIIITEPYYYQVSWISYTRRNI